MEKLQRISNGKAAAHFKMEKLQRISNGKAAAKVARDSLFVDQTRMKTKWHLLSWKHSEGISINSPILQLQLSEK